MGLSNWCFGYRDNDKEHIEPGTRKVCAAPPNKNYYKTDYNTHYLEFRYNGSANYTITSKPKITLTIEGATSIQQEDKPTLGHEGMFIVPDNFHIKLTQDANTWYAELEIDAACLGCC